MFYDLPPEIVTEIYTYDNTYRLIFDKVLQDIQQYKIFKSFDAFYVYDKYTFTLHFTDSLSIPSWICSSFKILPDKMKDIIDQKKLVLHTKAKLEFDITTFQFEPEYSQLRSL
jgi:hypothetical protein